MSEVNRLFAAAAATASAPARGGGRVQRRNAIRPNSIEAEAIRDIGVQHAHRRGSETSNESDNEAVQARTTVFVVMDAEEDDRRDGPKTSHGA